MPASLARRDVITAIRQTLAEAADHERAGPMQAYMKSALPYYGVPMPEVRRRVKRVLAEHRIDDAAGWDATIRELFDDASHREERYAALTLAAHRFYRGFATAVDALDLYEHLIRTGAWWDLVDETSHRVGDVLVTHRATVTPIMLAWSRSDDFWIRRSSIICQLGHKSDTDLDLLSAVIEANLDERDFFIRKAIGWALREVARLDAEWVHAFVVDHPSLSPLSVREATKHIGPPPGLND